MTNPIESSSPRIDFSRVADVYEATRGIPDNFMKELIEAVIFICEVQSDSLVLEVGCGTGRFLRALASQKISVVGLDISEGMLEKACLNQRSQKYLRSSLIAGDAISIPLNHGLFKVILAIHLFHLMTDWRQALTNIVQLLGPGGKLVTGFVGALAYESTLSQFYRRRRDELGYSSRSLGANPSEVVEELKTQGARIASHDFSTNVVVPVRETITHLEQRVFSSMWRNLPDIIHRQIMRDVYAEATTKFKTLDDTERLQINAKLYFAAFD